MAAAVLFQAQDALAAEKKIKIVASTFPIYQMTRNIVGDAGNLQLDLLIPATLGCPHDYVMNPQSVKKIVEADALIINGLGMEGFLEASLKRVHPDIKVIDSSKGITGLIKYAENQEHHGERGHQHAAHNPHLFASPAMAAKIIGNIAAELAKLDPGAAASYQARAAAYIKIMNELAAEFKVLGGQIKNNRIVTEHGVFDYLARDSALEVVAVVQESDGQEPSAAQIAKIIKSIQQQKAAAIFTEPQYPRKYSQLIAREAKIKLGILDPVASGPHSAPLDYYEKTMRENLKTLKTVLAASP
jgi:ABC-type Zn uptake system ZnuABC Zn-binding protein ZnuA